MTRAWTDAPAVALDADLPPEQRIAAVPERLIDRSRELLGVIAERFPPSYRHLARLAALRTLHRFTSEAKAVAGRVNVDWHQVFVANLSYDLVIASLGCSAIAVSTPDGPVLARNMDWAPERALARASMQLDLLRGGRPVQRTANWPGGIGVVTGLSCQGFAVALNAVFHPDGPDKLGYPVLLFLRRLLDEATGFDDALKRLQTQRLMTAGLFTLVGREADQRVVVERSPRRASLRWGEGDRPLIATNHYQCLCTPTGPLAFGLTGTSADRCAALTQLADGLHRADDDAPLLYALSDPSVIQTITAQHIIAHPKSDSLRLYVPSRLVEDETQPVVEHL